jgi:hypothetical protein
MVSYDVLLKMELDERSGFVLSLIDGQLSVGEILDACPFARHETIALLDGLLAAGAIVMRQRGK